MTLTLRKVTGHPQADNAYRVVYDGIEVGSIGLQSGTQMRTFWSWGIETVLPRQAFKTDGQAESREDAMAAFRIAWEKFIEDPDRLQAMRNARR